MSQSRREFLSKLGVGAAALPFVMNLSSVARADARRKQRVVFLFSPNGIVPSTFWPKETGENFKLTEILSPLEPYKSKTLILNGVCDKVRGDGDSHMRGMSCLLTGIELAPGNIQGGSDHPAGWAKGLSIDQEIKNFLQKDPATRTRFGSLEFGVMVPERADPWTRWSYAGPNKPVTPIDDPYQMFNKMYGRAKDQKALSSVLDDLTEDLKKISSAVTPADRKLLEEHASFVREMEIELKEAQASAGHRVPTIEPGVRKDNDNMPQISKAQIDLMVNAFQADFTRVASLQYTNSVGGARMKWLGINEGHHAISHNSGDPVADKDLTKINHWFCQQVAYLAKRLAETPEPGGEGNMLDNTTILWTNELGEGKSHTLDNIPFVLIGGGLGFKTGRYIKYEKVAHNRLLMSLAHGFGHTLKAFGNPNFCGDGVLGQLA